jgi:peptidoglycan/LPS O-acetylase OafA/YrhL
VVVSRAVLSSLPRPSPGPSHRATIPHLPALDGLRGAAVIGVLFFHDGRLRGGYLGVDLFFVLSGFLITSLLLAESRAAGRIDLRTFWIRRARRLFPAVLALLPAVALQTFLFAKPEALARIRGDGLATLFYYANWRSIFAGKSYWDLFDAPSPFEHTWSLSIEEQFYVVWPLVSAIVLARSRGSARPLLVTSLALALASAAAMALLFSPLASQRAYMGTDTRGGSILVGAALACLLSGRAPFGSPRLTRALDALGLLALLGLGLAWATLDGQSAFLYRGGFWLTELGVLVLIACAAQGDRSLVAKAISVAPLRWAGLVSYGLYLWHWPLYVLLTQKRVGFGGAGLTALRLGVTVAVALVSYHLLEQPIRKRGITFGRPILVVPAATAASVLCLLLATRAVAIPPPGAPAVAATGTGSAPRPPQYNDHITELPAKGSVPPGMLRVLVVGDSVAVALGDRLRFMQTGSNARVAVRAVGDCNVLDGQFLTRSLNNRRHDGGDCDAKWMSDVAELQPDVILVVLGGGFFAPVEIGGKWREACDPAWNEAIRAELLRNARALARPGVQVVLAKVPYPVEHWASERWDRATDCLNAALTETAAAVPAVRLLPMKEELCPGPDHTSCILESKGARVRPDGMHFEGLGGEEIAAWVFGRLR